MLALLKTKSLEISALCQRFGVRQLVLFGSAARQKVFSPGTSDIDFLVEFECDTSVQALQQYFELRKELSSVLGHPVDLVGINSITNPHMLWSINEDKEVAAVPGQCERA